MAVELKVKANNKTVHPECTVLINLSGEGGPNGRISVNDNVTLADLAVDLQEAEAQAPVFPQNQIASISVDATLDPETRAARIQEVIEEYKAASEAFANANGLTIEDRIVLAAQDYLVEKHGFTKDPQEQKPFIGPKELQVTAVPINNGEILFSVTGTAVWG